MFRYRGNLTEGRTYQEAREHWDYTTTIAFRLDRYILK